MTIPASKNVGGPTLFLRSTILFFFFLSRARGGRAEVRTPRPDTLRARRKSAGKVRGQGERRVGSRVGDRQPWSSLPPRSPGWGPVLRRHADLSLRRRCWRRSRSGPKVGPRGPTKGGRLTLSAEGVRPRHRFPTPYPTDRTHNSYARSGRVKKKILTHAPCSLANK